VAINAFESTIGYRRQSAISRLWLRRFPTRQVVEQEQIVTDQE
jgi:hypothetical protein